MKARNLTSKILEAHLIEGTLVPGAEIGIRIDHTLLQDATGTMAMLEFETLGLAKVKAALAAQYVDHNLLQTDSKNADDHKYLQTACARYGIWRGRRTVLAMARCTTKDERRRHQPDQRCAHAQIIRR